MGFTYIDTLTGSLEADNKPAIKMDIPIGNDSSAAGTKYFELQRYKNPIFYITKEGAVFASQFTGSVKGTSTTASFLTQTAQNATRQVAYYDGTGLKSATGLFFDNNLGAVKYLSLSSSLARNFITVGSRGSGTGINAFNQAGIQFTNFNDNKIYPNIDQWSLFNNVSGSLTFAAPIGSYQFSSSAVVAKSAASEVYGMVQIRNGFYFWPYMASVASARDGAIGIGVQPPTEPTGSFNKYLRAKLHINMFSGSGEGPWNPKATVEHRSTAILVNYGSGSANTGLTTNFYVSASGNTYMRGNLQVGGTISKGGGSFDIEHPDPSKEVGWILRHSFVESPTRGDNIYRYSVTTTQENLQSTIDLPDYYKHLNENTQIWVNPSNCFGIGYGSVNEELTQVTITTNIAGNYNVLLIGTRKDKLAKDYWDSKGTEYFDPKNIRFQNRDKNKES
jgi:hypothetical protein